ncbi:MAG: sulfatase-like hydrolase/transferase [Prosthecobacter sp.]|jgi:arylsulfatase A-like enzyme|uniref:sulfatase family protein n=1 Tax=Prosthecobacter sp. TaxID=1965333 RepID=UPI0019EB5D4C|nr:arylsulfatase [Prosthecobacter sp.]MBE2286567.1 sulfatase-like hydrolase/transferase [Prosthecobacter sp.]
MRFLLAVLVSSFCILHSSFAATQRPNIIVIMADDLGYGDLGCYGAKAVQTPNIDRLAAEGVRFTSGYCSAATCTPTRFSFITGTYAFRQKGTGVAPPNGPALIKPGTATISSLLKQAGYATAVIGKWHLGLGDPKPDWNGDLKPGPLEIGFDHCFLLPTTNDRVPQVYVNDHRVQNLDAKDPLWVGDKAPDENHPTGITHRSTLRMDWTHGHNQTIHNGIGRIGFYTGGTAARFRDEDLGDAWIKESNQWIESHKDQPFFLFFASHDIHVPRMPHERFQGKTPLGFRGDAVVEFDWSVGEIMKTLDRLHLAENTLIVLCSDNGPVLDDGYKDGAVEKLGDHKPAGPFSGGKYSVFEGGTRTPFITRWKGRVKPGVSDEIVCTIDLAASFAALNGVSLPENACRDSFNVLPALLGESGAKGRDHLLQQDNNGTNFGLRAGDWKLVRMKAKGKSQAIVTKKVTPLPTSQHALYHLADDPGEEHDLSAKNPEKTQEMIAKLDALIAAERSR